MKWVRRFKRHHWTKLANAESITGEWDWFYPSIDGKKDYIKLVRFDEENNRLAELHMTKESWEDLVQLIRRIT